MKKLFLLGTVLTALLTTSFKIGDSSKKDTGFSYVALKSSYETGESINIPGSLVEIDGTQYNANHIVTYPSGIRSNAKTIVLNETGTYQLEYYYVKDGKYYKDVTEFKAISPVFKLGSHSSAYYGVPLNEGGKEGLIVTLATNETIEFAQTIDINTLNKDTRFFESYVYPFTRGTADFGAIFITLTNPQNPEEYIRFRLTQSVSEKLYPALGDVAVQGNGTDFIGDDLSRGPLYFVHHNDGDGTKVRSSFRGISPKMGKWYNPVTKQIEEATGYSMSTPLDTSPLRINFDYATKSTYTFSSYYSADGLISSEIGNGPLLVADLDNQNYCDLRPWNGFSSNYVKLSISASKYVGEKARFVITKAAGIDLLATSVSDTIAPEITINSDLDINSMPIGKPNLAYQIPFATAIDNVDGFLPIKTTIWKDYGTDKASNVEIINNCFTPKSVGNYSIEYTSQDYSGNVGTKLLKVVVSEETDPVNIEINESEKITESYLGKKITLPSVTYSGGSGPLTSTIIASIGNHEEVIDEERNFTPEIEGKWTISYVITDFLNQKTIESYELNITKSQTPILATDFYGDKYIVSYADYKIPEPNIIDYVDGKKVNADYEVNVKIGEGTTTKYHKGDSIYLGEIENQTKITFDYICGEKTILSTESTIINPFTKNQYNAKQLQIDRYFVSNDANIEFVEPEISTPEYEIGAKISSKDNNSLNVDFANKVLSEVFTLKLSTLKDYDTYSNISIKLTDSFDHKNSLTVDLFKNETGVYLKVPGHEDMLLLKPTEDAYHTFVIKYSNGELKVDNLSFPIPINDNKSIFNGFSSGRVNISLSSSGLTNDNYFIVNQIGNHSIIKSSSSLVDYTNPEIYIRDDRAGTYNLGDTIHTSVVDVQDVLALNSVVTLTAIDSETNQYVKDDNGVELNRVTASKSYDITFNKYYSITFTYTAKEIGGEKYWQNENVYENAFISICVDIESPTITFNTFMNETCKVNDTLALAEFTVTDNTPIENIEVSRYMVVPSGRITKIESDKKSYKFTEKGKFEYRVVARDPSGNIGINSLYIKVE